MLTTTSPASQIATLSRCPECGEWIAQDPGALPIAVRTSALHVHWSVRTGWGRKAHRLVGHRKVACGQHLGYGNLIHDQVPQAPSLCARCYPAR